MATEKQAAKKDTPLDMNPDRVEQWRAEKNAESFMSAEEIDDLLRHGNVLYITHTLKDGWPLVTPMLYCVLGKDVYTTTVKGRIKEVAYRRDNRMSASVSREDTTMTNEQAVTIKGRAEIIEDREFVRKVVQGYVDKYWAPKFPPDVQKKYFEALYTKNRVAIKIVPEKIISWDMAKISKAGK
jgi:nitroimidazol reductase NimA-like FMN-containing flavoprotein (pyridoxamine 5'-phosphate oxidase superfamily)